MPVARIFVSDSHNSSAAICLACIQMVPEGLQPLTLYRSLPNLRSLFYGALEIIPGRLSNVRSRGVRSDRLRMSSARSEDG
jgi:hypothetical protein